MAFGKRRLKFETAQEFELSGKIPMLHLAEEEILLEELLLRSSDKIIIHATSVELEGEEFNNQKIIIEGHSIFLADRIWALEKALPLTAHITEITLPREAMGFGDVKFLACIGAFLSWKGMLFSLFAGSIIGAITGSLLLLITHGEKGRRLPFGPYLAAGALLWIFEGRTLMTYFQW